MLIRESQMGFNTSYNSFALLDNMAYLSEAESFYSPALVPVVENTNVGAHLIRLEDLVSFSEANGIEDLGYALSTVCEASEIDPSTVAFTVQEESIISDPSLADLAGSLMNEGVGVIAKPVSPYDPACLAVDVALECLFDYGDTSLLEAVAEGDYDYFFEAASKLNMDKSSYENIGNTPFTFGADDVKAYNKGLAKDLNARAKAAHKDNAKAAKAIDGKLATIWQKLKNGVGITRDWLAKGIAWLRGIAVRIEASGKSLPEEQRGVWDKIKSAIGHALEVMTRKLHNLVQANRGDINEIEIGTSDKAMAAAAKQAAKANKKNPNP